MRMASKASHAFSLWHLVSDSPGVMLDRLWFSRPLVVLWASMNGNPHHDVNAMADLLRPTLTETDDSVGIHQPWRPQTLLFLTFLFGSLAGSILFALNSKRLGLKREFWVFLLGGLALVVILQSTVLAAALHWQIDRQAENSWLLLRSVRRVIPVVIGWFVSAPQRRRFRLALASGVVPGALWKVGVPVCLLGAAMEGAIGVGCYELFKSMFVEEV